MQDRTAARMRAKVRSNCCSAAECGKMAGEEDV
jgi:hypothetical protein